MRKLWQSINFIPNSFAFSAIEDEEDADKREKDIPIRDTERFSPKLVRPDPTPQDIAKYEGLTVQNFPKSLRMKTSSIFLKRLVMRISLTKQQLNLARIINTSQLP